MSARFGQHFVLLFLLPPTHGGDGPSLSLSLSFSIDDLLSRKTGSCAVCTGASLFPPFTFLPIFSHLLFISSLRQENGVQVQSILCCCVNNVRRKKYCSGVQWRSSSIQLARTHHQVSTIPSFLSLSPSRHGNRLNERVWYSTGGSATGLGGR